MFARSGRSGWMLAAALFGIATLVAEPAAAEESNVPTGRLVGTVTVQETGEPVAGAQVRVITGEKDDIGLGYLNVEATTDADGRYEVKLPLGHVMSFNPVLPPGYWSSVEPAIFVTTLERPAHTKNFHAQRGPTCRIRIEADETAAALLPELIATASRTTEPYVSVQAFVDASGCTALTLPESGGEFQIGFADRGWRLFSERSAQLSMEPGFQPQRVVAARRDDDAASVIFEDESGRRATLTDGEGAVVDGCVEIRFRASLPSGERAFTLTGKVVDQTGEAIPHAIVAVVSGNPQGGSFLTLFHARTEENGRFTIADLPKSMFSGEERQLFLMVRRDGFAGVDTRYRPVPDDVGQEPLDFGTIKLSPGYSARVRVVDADGKPAVGAQVTPSGGYAAGAESSRTDIDGRCTIRNLDVGVHGIDVQFGELYANARLVVASGDADETLVRLRHLPEAEADDASDTEANPLVVGEEVPEWEVFGWTDGVERRLSDYRGKVVVIDVWGVWCSPCVNAIPGLKEVEARFRDRDVVFLSIHTAGTELDQVRKLMKLKEWDWPTGLDAGDDIETGATVRRYRVNGFPTTIVVGRDGKVYFSTGALDADHDALMKEIEQIAGECGIAWPMSDDLPDDEAIQHLNRIFAELLAKEIGAALEAQ